MAEAETKNKTGAKAETKITANSNTKTEGNLITFCGDSSGLNPAPSWVDLRLVPRSSKSGVGSKSGVKILSVHENYKTDQVLTIQAGIVSHY